MRGGKDACWRVPWPARREGSRGRGGGFLATRGDAVLNPDRLADLRRYPTKSILATNIPQRHLWSCSLSTRSWMGLGGLERLLCFCLGAFGKGQDGEIGGAVLSRRCLVSVHRISANPIPMTGYFHTARRISPLGGLWQLILLYSFPSNTI